MNLTRVNLSLDPRTVAHLTLLAEEQQTTLVDLIRDVLDQHLLDDVRNRRTQGGAEGAAGETFAYALPQEWAEEISTLRAWVSMSPEARWYAAERGLVQPPWAGAGGGRDRRYRPRCTSCSNCHQFGLVSTSIRESTGPRCRASASIR